MADPPTSGLSVARQMAMISYRNAKVQTHSHHAIISNRYWRQYRG